MLKRLHQYLRSFTFARFLRGSKYIGAGALIFDPDGRILMIKNRLRGRWEYPAGGAHGPESPFDTCRREVAEEVGLNLTRYRLIGVDYWRQLTPNGNILFTFAQDINAKQARKVRPQALEVSDWRWATRAEALELIAPKLRPRFEQLLLAYDEGKPVYLHTGSPVF